MLWGLPEIDRSASRNKDNAAKNGLISLMNPRIKGFLTDEGYDRPSDKGPTGFYGGHGYIEEWGKCPSSPPTPGIAMILPKAPKRVQALILWAASLSTDGGKHAIGLL